MAQPGNWEAKVQVVISPENVDKFTFYRSVVSPFVESYWLAAKSLFTLVDKTMDSAAFHTYLIDQAKEQLSNGLIIHRKSRAFPRLVTASDGVLCTHQQKTDIHLCCLSHFLADRGEHCCRSTQKFGQPVREPEDFGTEERFWITGCLLD